MGFIFEVKGGHINLKLENYEVQGYEFSYSVPDSKYAKGHKDQRELIIRGSISETLTKSPEAMAQIRKWSDMEYEDMSYYHQVRITHIHGDKIIREVYFPHAFIKHYKEIIDPYKGDGTYIIRLWQKLDRRIEIEIGPFNEVHPKLSEVWAAQTQKKEKLITIEDMPVPLAAVANQEDEYWVAKESLNPSTTFLVPTAIVVRNSVTGTINLRERPGSGNESRVVGTVTARQNLTVVGGVISDGRLWYNVMHNSNAVWIAAEDNNGNRLVDGPPARSIAGMRVSSRNAIVVTSDVLRVRNAPNGTIYTSLPEFNGGVRTNNSGSVGLRDRTVVELFYILWNDSGSFDNPVRMNNIDWVRVRSWRWGATSTSLTLNENATHNGYPIFPQKYIDFVKAYETHRMENGKFILVNNGKTIGYGHDVLPEEDFSDGLTVQEAHNLLISDLNDSYDRVRRMINTLNTSFGYNINITNFTENEILFLVDFAFNRGGGLVERPDLMSSGKPFSSLALLIIAVTEKDESKIIDVLMEETKNLAGVYYAGLKLRRMDQFEILKFGEFERDDDINRDFTKR